MNHSVGVIILIVSWAICVYLLTVLWRIHHVHESRAWRFIFAGLTLLMVECAVGAHLAYQSIGLLSIEELIFIAIMLAKAVCYAVGFTIWKRDIEWLRNLAKQRRAHMAFDEEDDDDKPQQPEHPQPPSTPPGKPIRPQDDPQPPGDPQGPGKGGGGGGG